MEFEDTVTILNRLGLHARPAARFAQKASEFNADVWLVKDGKKVDGKNILEVLTLVCPRGSILTVRAVGSDSNQAVTELKTLVENHFGELD